MSDMTDNIRRAVGSEWISTREVALTVPPARKQGDYDHIRTVYKHLDHMLRQGYLEKRVEGTGGNRIAYWRRLRHEHVWEEHEPLTEESYVRYTDVCRICGIIRLAYVWNDGERDVYFFDSQGDVIEKVSA
jgi:hypothetical protein